MRTKFEKANFRIPHTVSAGVGRLLVQYPTALTTKSDQTAGLETTTR